MKTRIVKLLLVVALSGCQACEEELELPPITTEGKNTFGCKVNGSIYMPQGGALQGGSKGADVTFEGGVATLNLWTANFKTNQAIQLIIFDKDDLIEGKEYNLSTPDFFIEYSEEKPSICFFDVVTLGYLTILKYDRTNNIVSGTFTFSLVSNLLECPDKKTITEGRFDMIFEQYYKD
jgi:hypothetical protein